MFRQVTVRLLTPNMIMLKQGTLLLLFFWCSIAVAQSSFKKLSCPEKKWVALHPVKAIKARHITKEVLLVVDSVKQSELIGTDNNGGRLDAFKHAYWMGRLTQTIGAKAARKLGIAHEKGNYFQYKSHMLEDSALPDSVSSAMDLNNNELGISRGIKLRSNSYLLRKTLLVSAADDFLYTIKKDDKGNFLTCEGTIIGMKDWTGKWNIPKCLVISDRH